MTEIFKLAFFKTLEKLAFGKVVQKIKKPLGELGARLSNAKMRGVTPPVSPNIPAPKPVLSQRLADEAANKSQVEILGQGIAKKKKEQLLKNMRKPGTGLTDRLKSIAE